MANDVVTKAPALPPALVSKIAEGIAKSHIGAASATRGHTLLRMDKGVWLIGQNNEHPQDGASWLVNVTTFAHGRVVWHDSQPLDEVMVPMWEPMPEMPSQLHPTGEPYKAQLAVELRCMNGTDKGLTVLYKNSSMGGTEALFALKHAFQSRVEERGAGDPYIFPIVTLDSSNYPNKRHGGFTFKPIFTITGWADINGDIEGEAPLAGPAPEPKPVKPAKPSLRAVETEPVAGQRRRPGR
jgi:hypothetical protein